MYQVQVRKPGRAYKTVNREQTAGAARWAFNQHLTPDGRNSVRVLDPQGEVISWAVPKKG